MQTFIQANPGLQSRILITFSDYTVDEMYTMLQLMVQKNGFQLAVSCEPIVKELFNQEQSRTQSGNGRYVRNLFERASRNMSFRLSVMEDPTYEQLTTLEAEDFQKSS
ncbi:hypothetical protein [Gracilibacillus alcaliphilus]|uniref:hypothetical protein n=1 Tax=Gracilibacillus alcaliphilus TaxID=1401441 RepID=UPI001959353C|nr:hypothetical protein [Gracilibacillus alcaliphilus]MBM7677224.1 hypothetical protein [Gracilibacillus alcaliphilus]